MEGATIWDLVKRFAGQVRTAGMGGIATGLDMGLLVTVAGENGIRADMATALASAAESGLVKAWNTRIRESGKK
ncbi:MAG: hypothetical protein P1U37_06555 [Minwuia sp.]|nr:hypothetical protein [Minwuia sp.]